MTDRWGNVLQFNPAAEEIFGYRLDDVLGRPLSDLIIPPEYRDKHDAAITRMNETGQMNVVGAGRVQLLAMRADGDYFPVELALQIAGEGDEQIVIGFLRDISARLADQNELIEARDRAVAGERAKSEFLAMMSHEIRTPLNGVIGNLSLLRHTRLNPRQARYLRNMELSADLLLNQVNMVLDITRMETGAVTILPEPTHLGRLVQDIVDAQAGLAEERDNVLHWSWQGEPVTHVMADGKRLTQILLNLVGNAIKFTSNGRIVVELERQPTTASDRIAVEFRVIDTGIGMPPEEVDRIFEDFHTIDSSLDRNADGAGLGLGIVRRLVTAMGGTYGVESEVGEGSVFWFRLDFEPAEGQPAAPETRRARNAGKALDVLVVEDNEINAELAREMLQQEGHRVELAPDGLAGVAAANAQHFDLILMDISMPGMDGLEATRRIRAGDGPCRNTTIIAFSANVLPEMRRRIAEAGMDDLLAKPLQIEGLRKFLSDAPARHVAAPAKSPERHNTGQKAHGSTAMINERFAARYRSEVEDLFAWLSSGVSDLPEIAARCHKVAGSAAVFGHDRLRAALIAIEAHAERNGSPAELSSLIEAAKATWVSAEANLPQPAP